MGRSQTTVEMQWTISADHRGRDHAAVGGVRSNAENLRMHVLSNKLCVRSGVKVGLHQTEWGGKRMVRTGCRCYNGRSTRTTRKQWCVRNRRGRIKPALAARGRARCLFTITAPAADLSGPRLERPRDRYGNELQLEIDVD